jgi:hypothetical protein
MQVKSNGHKRRLMAGFLYGNEAVANNLLYEVWGVFTLFRPG